MLPQSSMTIMLTNFSVFLPGIVTLTSLSPKTLILIFPYFFNLTLDENNLCDGKYLQNEDQGKIFLEAPVSNSIGIKIPSILMFKFIGSFESIENIYLHSTLFSLEVSLVT